eukprot:7672463-Pyramimonas_sp.AAC.1
MQQGAHLSSKSNRTRAHNRRCASQRARMYRSIRYTALPSLLPVTYTPSNFSCREHGTFEVYFSICVNPNTNSGSSLEVVQ